MFENELGSEAVFQIKCRITCIESTGHRLTQVNTALPMCTSELPGGCAGWGCSGCAFTSHCPLDQWHPVRISKAWLESTGSRKLVNRKLEQAPRGVWALLTNPLELKENEKNITIGFPFHLKVWGSIFDLFNNTCLFRVRLQAQHSTKWVILPKTCFHFRLFKINF